MFDTFNGYLAAKGLLLKEGAIVAATIIAAPLSTKNKAGEHDLDMHRTEKGNQWHFGMKAHIGVDADSDLAHTVVPTAANVNDLTQAHVLLHGEETHAFSDAGYTGVTKREQINSSKVTWHVAMKPGKCRVLPATLLGKLLEKIEHAKASIRAKVEHPFHVVKNLFRHRDTRYRGLAKITAQLSTLFGMANLILTKKLDSDRRLRYVLG